MRAACVLFLTAPAWGHVVSMSFGDMRIDGATAEYELRMPVYEIDQLKDPGKTLLENISFAGGRLLDHQCSREQETLRCTARYLFAREVGELRATCSFPAVTIPNHVHILRAVKKTGEREQAYFDLGMKDATLTFRAPTAFELTAKSAAEGLRRGLTGLTTALFLCAIAVAAKDRKQFLLLAGILTAVEIAAAMSPAPMLSLKFLEAAAALSTAYLAIERVLIPEAGQRWLVVAVLGVFHGLLLRNFAMGNQPQGFSLGLMAANCLWLLPAAALRFLPAKPPAIALFAVGAGWFVYRMLA